MALNFIPVSSLFSHSIGTYINATAISDNTMTSSPKETSSPKTGTESDPWVS